LADATLAGALSACSRIQERRFTGEQAQARLAEPLPQRLDDAPDALIPVREQVGQLPGHRGGVDEPAAAAGGSPSQRLPERAFQLVKTLPQRARHLQSSHNETTCIDRGDFYVRPTDIPADLSDFSRSHRCPA